MWFRLKRQLLAAGEKLVIRLVRETASWRLARQLCVSAWKTGQEMWRLGDTATATAAAVVNAATIECSVGSSASMQRAIKL
jgi:hypothetical protein